MKKIGLLLSLAIAILSANAMATESLTEMIPPSCSADTEANGAVVFNCANGETFELRQISPTSQKCVLSVFCSIFDHCVDGKCVPKDAFHRCDPFHTCTPPDKCVDGVCK